MSISFCITNIDDVVSDEASAFPVIGIVYKATGSYAGTCILGSLLVVLVYFQTVTTVASASRQIWAFSRDQVCTLQLLGNVRGL